MVSSDYHSAVNYKLAYIGTITVAAICKEAVQFVSDSSYAAAIPEHVGIDYVH